MRLQPLRPLDQAHPDELARWLSIAVLAIASVVLVVGWGLDVRHLRRLTPDFAAMVPSTATLFILSATAIILWQTVRRPLALNLCRTAGAIVVAVAVADVIIIALTPRNGIDQAVLPTAPVFRNASMASGTAISFILAGIALWRLGRERKGKNDLPFTACATAGLLIAATALTGYLFDASALYEVSVFTAMALHTALAFTALFAALLLARSDIGWVALLREREEGSASARKLLPATIALPVVLCFFALVATDRGLFNANFRLSMVAIVMATLLSAAVLFFARIQNGVERKLRLAVQDRDLLLREVYHRVKNNLQMTNALLRMGINSIDDGHAQEVLESTAKRVEALGTVHRLLISAPVPSQVDTRDFFEELCANAADGQAFGATTVEVKTDIDELLLPVDRAVTIGLLANELLINAYKHAFPGGRDGTLFVGFKLQDDAGAILTVADDGVGFDPEAPDHSPGIGARVIEGLVAQLDGTIDRTRSDGMTVTIAIPPASLKGESPHD